MKIKSVVRTRVTTITCAKCHKEIYSRARYDFRQCGCSANTFVDGGFEYFRAGWNTDCDKPIIRIRYVQLTRKDLFSDWNRGTDKLGVINAKA